MADLDRAWRSMAEEGASSARARRTALIASLLADVANKRDDLLSGRTLAWCGVATFGTIATVMWAWGSWQDRWEGPAWIAGVCVGAGLLCDGGAAMLDGLRRRLEQRITAAGMTVRWPDARAGKPNTPAVSEAGERV